jgi:hypothetical protein
MTTSLLKLWVLIGALCSLTGAQGPYYENLLPNPDFELDLKGNWKNNGFTMERVTGSQCLTGTYCLKCSGR